MCSQDRYVYYLCVIHYWGAPLLSRWGHEKHSAYKSAYPDSESVAQFRMQTQIQKREPKFGYACPHLDICTCALSLYYILRCREYILKTRGRIFAPLVKKLDREPTISKMHGPCICGQKVLPSIMLLSDIIYLLCQTRTKNEPKQHSPSGKEQFFMQVVWNPDDLMVPKSKLFIPKIVVFDLLHIQIY